MMNPIKSKLIQKVTVVYVLELLIVLSISGIIFYRLFAGRFIPALFCATLTGVLAIIFTGIFLSKTLGRKISLILEGLAQHAGGNFQHKIYLHDKNELRMIADAMNHMASTLQKHSDELDEEKRKLSTLLDHMAEGVIAVGADNQVEFVNPAACHMFGVSVESVKDKSLLEITRSERLDDMMRLAIRQRILVDDEVEWAHPEEKIFKAQAVGISKKSEHAAGILFLYDMTEVRKLEGMRREFVANVSHELRTPLTSIKGFVETLLGGAYQDGEQCKKFLKIMEEDTTRLTRLIDDLLELSKLDSRKIDLSIETLNVYDEIEKAIAKCQPLGVGKKVIVRNRLSSESTLRIFADPDKVQQILINLIDNAIKFNREGGNVWLDAKQIGREIYISVEDTGCGIPAEAIARIFERFFRVDKARSRALGGTGLGLAIVKRLAEAQKGKVFCESAVDDGSKFTFTVPCADF